MFCTWVTGLLLRWSGFEATRPELPDMAVPTQ
jgi:hypothetical protein